MKYLLIESFPISPHFEASLEIALDLKRSGNDVTFFWCGYDLPWSDWDLSIYKKILLFSYKNKILRAQKFLEKNGIKIIKKFKLGNKINNKIDKEVGKIKDFEKIYSYKYKKKIKIGLSAYSSLVSRYHNENLKLFKKKAKKAYKAGCIVYERADKIIKLIKPNYVITFNSRFVISKPIHEAAMVNKVKVHVHERGSLLNKYEIFKGDIFDRNFMFNHVSSYWNNEKNLIKKKQIVNKYFSLLKEKKLYKKLGYDFENLSKNKISIDRRKKILLYLCSTDYEHRGVNANINKLFINKKWSKQINTIKSIIKIIKNDKNILMLIKSHPNSDKKDNFENELRKLNYENVIFLTNSNKVDTLDLIKKSNLIFGFATSLELYSVYCKKKVISFFKNEIWGNFNIVQYPKNEKDLKKIIYNPNVKKNIKNKLFKVIYYLMTFGIKFKYFKPYGHSRGVFSEKKINHYGPLFNLFFDAVSLLQNKKYKKNLLISKLNKI